MAVTLNLSGIQTREQGINGMTCLVHPIDDITYDVIDGV
jgi:hypothetical protein